MLKWSLEELVCEQGPDPTTHRASLETGIEHFGQTFLFGNAVSFRSLLGSLRWSNVLLFSTRCCCITPHPHRLDQPSTPLQTEQAELKFLLSHKLCPRWVQSSHNLCWIVWFPPEQMVWHTHLVYHGGNQHWLSRMWTSGSQRFRVY
jgi:hypothetical protein